MSWEVPTKDFCPDCGKTLFKPAGKGAKKAFCINPDCKSFVPEDKRGYRRRAKTDAAKSGDEAGKKPAKKSAAKKPAAKKTKSES